MLTEHFRCVAPIIEFSKGQFYGHRLTPLRLPTASERLDPPLIDVFVEDGFRKGDVNVPEAEFIVSEIAAIAEDERMSKRTIGVTTLLGQNQAAHIYKEIEQRLGTEVMERHTIRVGDPTAFQGDERDVMFVSLVAQREDSPLSGNRYEQRFNVALSRARDRTYLVRSVELDQLRTSDQLRRSLLEHFRCPYPAETSDLKDRRDRCESDFEREMFDLLCERGFRVNTQVRVGNFRIDLVVEGDNDQRIAIECDGDRYHGPDKWPDDMMRQRILERAGWTIWRCFASRFVRNRQVVVDEVAAFLAARGIEPINDGEEWISHHTELRTWRLPSPEDAEPAPAVGQSPPDDGATDDAWPAPVQKTDVLSAAEGPDFNVNLTRVTESQVQNAILNLMSDKRVWSNGELKGALVDVLALSDADRAPANFRPGEEKWEELVNNALSPSRGNSLHSKGLVKSAGRGLHVLSDDDMAGPAEKAAVVRPSSPEDDEKSYSPPAIEIGTEYQIASLVVPLEEVEQIYQPEYKPRLERLIDATLQAEAPMYEDILIERIARAHKKSGQAGLFRISLHRQFPIVIHRWKKMAGTWCSTKRWILASWLRIDRPDQIGDLTETLLSLNSRAWLCLLSEEARRKPMSLPILHGLSAWLDCVSLRGSGLKLLSQWQKRRARIDVRLVNALRYRGRARSWQPSNVGTPLLRLRLQQFNIRYIIVFTTASRFVYNPIK